MAPVLAGSEVIVCGKKVVYPKPDPLAVIEYVGLQLREQGERSATSIMTPTGKMRPICRYRDGHGHACAVGWMIPDAQYRPSMETRMLGGGPILALVQELLAGRAMLTWLRKLMFDVQNVHDRVEIHNWPTAFDELAIRWKSPQSRASRGTLW